MLRSQGQLQSSERGNDLSEVTQQGIEKPRPLVPGFVLSGWQRGSLESQLSLRGLDVSIWPQSSLLQSGHFRPEKQLSALAGDSWALNVLKFHSLEIKIHSSIQTGSGRQAWGQNGGRLTSPKAPLTFAIKPHTLVLLSLNTVLNPISVTPIV